VNSETSGKLFEFYLGTLSKMDVPALFQTLVDTGEIWALPHFLDTAGILLTSGLIGSDAKDKLLRGLDS
jgi:hypothetical protein